MKTQPKLIIGILLLINSMFQARGQGTFQYDQQSSVEGNATDATIPSINAAQTLGQSFTPSLPSVGFIRLAAYDSSVGNNQAAAMEVVLHSDSITGPILGTSDSVNLVAGFVGTANFFFSSPVSVTPGTAYYFQPIVLSGDEGLAQSKPFQYAGGIEYIQGAPSPTLDLWFREGIIVPEPSTWALVVLGGGAGWLFRRRFSGRQ